MPAVIPIFVLGSPRSGTTLMGRYLGSSRHVCDLGEFLGFYLAHHVAKREFAGMPSPFAAQYLRAMQECTSRFAADLTARWNCDFYCDDTPWNLLVAHELARDLPQAVFVLMLRHYSGVIQSMHSSYADGYTWAGSTLEESADLWKRFYSCALSLPPGRTIPVSYDGLLQAPWPTLTDFHERIRSMGIDERSLDVRVFTVSHATKPRHRARPLAVVDVDGRVVLGPLPSFRAHDWSPTFNGRIRSTVHPVEVELLKMFGRHYKRPAGFVDPEIEWPPTDDGGARG